MCVYDLRHFFFYFVYVHMILVCIWCLCVSNQAIIHLDVRSKLYGVGFLLESMIGSENGTPVTRLPWLAALPATSSCWSISDAFTRKGFWYWMIVMSGFGYLLIHRIFLHNLWFKPNAKLQQTIIKTYTRKIKLYKDNIG